MSENNTTQKGTNGFNVPISTALRRFKSKIDFLQPMIEAITNSLEAGAQNIWVKLYKEKKYQLPLDSNKFKISSYEIKDDGNGFTEKDIDSFSTYMSEHKIKLGCKGVGRITWLKVFNKAEITSWTKNKKISFVFDKNFSGQHSINREIYQGKQRGTLVNFSNITTQYYNDKEDHRADANFDEILNHIKEVLFVKLYLLKSSSKTFNIFINDDLNNTKGIINHDSLTSLLEHKFTIFDDNKNSFDFSIYYSLFSNREKQKNTVCYCANGRVVENVDNKKISIDSLPNNTSSLFLITSKFFDDHVNDERNEFDIAKNSLPLLRELNWEKINLEVQNQIDNIILTNFPHIKKHNNNIIKELINDYPHLTTYIKNDSSKIKNKTKILERAKKNYEKEKETISANFKKLLNENLLDSEEFNKSLQAITDMSARELAEYIMYRQQIILALQKFNKENEKYEEKFHNIFMKKRTESFAKEHETYDNNLWLFDDKFMTYVYASSDETIKKIAKSFGENRGTSARRPDIAIFFSKNESSNDIKDVIAIELKASGAKLDEKERSLFEITRNAQSIRDNINNIGRIWYYTITCFDDKFKKDLETQDYKPLFTNTYKEDMYYKYFNYIDTHCYFLSFDAIIEDANARNNVFLDIIRKNSTKTSSQK